jgi:hypothetical protein
LARNNQGHPLNLFACFADDLTPSDERLLRALLADEDAPDPIRPRHRTYYDESSNKSARYRRRRAGS